MERFEGASFILNFLEGMGMEGCVGRSLISVVCDGMERLDGGRGSRVGGCGWMGMIDFLVLMLMRGCGLDGEHFVVAAVDGWGWLVFRLREVASGCRCILEGIQKRLVLQEIV